MFAAVVADSRPLRDAHPELRVAIVKMEDALRDLYEAADAVLIKELETHPRPEVARKLDNYGAPVGQRAPGRSIRHIASRANSEAR